MSKTLDFYFDYGSPNAYLAHTQMPGLAERTGADVVYKPMLLGGVFKATGNVSPATVPAKSRYMGIDMARFIARYGVPFQRNPHFPVNTLALMRGAVFAERAGFLAPYSEAMFKAMWVDGLNMAEPEVIGKVLAEAGLDVDAILAGVQDQAVKDALIAKTEEAVERGVFGAPTFFVGDEMFFGQDRLEMVEAALMG